MGIPKSHVQENLLALVVETLVDAYASLRCCDPSLERLRDFDLDLDYLSRRFCEEGPSFLTISLPKLGDFLDRFVWGEQVERVAGFKPFDGLFPVFLRPFWLLFQKMRNGDCDEQHAQCYRIVRTLLLGLKKLDVPCAPELVQQKLNSFREIEIELGDFYCKPTISSWYAQRLLELFTQGYQPRCDRPKHGPGAVAGGERHNEKWTWSTLYESVHAEFPYWEYFCPVRSIIEGDSTRRSRPLQLAANAGLYRSLQRVNEPTAKLLLVPKDSRGPRVISCEPAELMYLQQGVSTHLMDYIERHPYTHGHVNFERQDINGQLALIGSESNSWDTIDLSDASDRVSCALVKYLFPKEVTKKWLALRSTSTILPTGEIVSLNKFAPMGSALCFPVESLVFWALAVGVIWNHTGDFDTALQSVYVYGDDIIIATGYTQAVMNELTVFGLKVNMEKSFIGGHPFRESCGVEAFKGFNVTPYRVKSLPPQRPSDGTSIVAWLDYASNCQHDLPSRSKFQLGVVERLIGRVPRVPVTQDYLCFVTETDTWSHDDFRNLTWDAHQSYWVAPLTYAKTRKHESAIPGWSRLQRNLVQGVREGDPTMVVDRSSTLIRKGRKPVTFLASTRASLVLT